MWNLKIQQASEYNKKKQTHGEQTSSYQWGGERRKYRGGGVGGTNYWVEDRLKDVLYNTGKTANIL